MEHSSGEETTYLIVFSTRQVVGVSLTNPMRLSSSRRCVWSHDEDDTPQRHYVLTRRTNTMFPSVVVPAMISITNRSPTGVVVCDQAPSPFSLSDEKLKDKDHNEDENGVWGRRRGVEGMGSR